MPARVVLLDIEGTTSPISFVYETLFPYARKNLQAYLAVHRADPEISDALRLLASENALDVKNGSPIISGSADDPDCLDSAVAYCLWLMDRDRKSTSLKIIQGLIWQQGFLRNELRSEVFPDVPVSFAEWHRQ